MCQVLNIGRPATHSTRKHLINHHHFIHENDPDPIETLWSSLSCPEEEIVKNLSENQDKYISTAFRHLGDMEWLKDNPPTSDSYKKNKAILDYYVSIDVEPPYQYPYVPFCEWIPTKIISISGRHSDDDVLNKKNYNGKGVADKLNIQIGSTIIEEDYNNLRFVQDYNRVLYRNSTKKRSRSDTQKRQRSSFTKRSRSDTQKRQRSSVTKRSRSDTQKRKKSSLDTLLNFAKSLHLRRIKPS